jgi:transposase
VKGRKRHRLVDTLGRVLRVLVHPADVSDQEGGQWRLEAHEQLAQAFPRLSHLWADAADREQFVAWVQQTLHWTVDVVQRPRRWFWVPPGGEPPALPRGFTVQPRRWVVERTFGWLGRWRRTSKDDEYLPATSACVVYLAMTCLMLRRLAET